MGAMETIATDAMRDHVSEAEWQARVDLAACYRLVAHYGMSDLIYNHITARVPGTEHLLLNAYGFLYSEITASNLVKIDLEGNIVTMPETVENYGINYSGYVIHGAVHEARPDVGCVIHTHSRAGMAVSCMKEGLLPLTQTSLRFYNRVGYHDYQSVAFDLAERESLVADLGRHDVMILRNHGVLACGGNVPEAFNTLYWLENACRLQVDVMRSGAEIVYPSAEISEKTAKILEPNERRRFGNLEWPAMLRQLDAKDPSFRF